MRIGLFGGSFDPPHDGHAQLTRAALRRLRLDRVWWLVSPGNPLKSRAPEPLHRRLAEARAVMDHPQVEITDIEARLGTRYTAATLKRLQALYPGVRFVWLMGADNLQGFHLWDNWQSILRSVPVAVFARPGCQPRARLAPAAQIFADARLREDHAGTLAERPPPAWVFLNMPLRDLSSSGLRRADWRPRPRDWRPRPRD